MTYSQNDPQWKTEVVGNSSLPFGGKNGVGCTVTSLTNLMARVAPTLGITPLQVNSALKKTNGFLGALILWGKIPLAFPFLKFVWRGYTYDNLKVSWYVYVKHLPVLVEVNNSGTKHWVLYIGNRQLIDPLDGRVYPTNKYPATGYALLDVV